MSRFRQEYQGVNLTLNEMRTNLQVEALLQGQLHVGLLHTPLYTDSLATQVIYRENLVLVYLPLTDWLIQ
jgi:DNA-binding transcriptional LysR family regulator